jgi:hypothetical protein
MKTPGRDRLILPRWETYPKEFQRNVTPRRDILEEAISQAKLSDASDSVHFRRAVQEGRTILTHNYDDFEDLHWLVIDAGGGRPGVLIMRRDNPKRRNMKPHDIVRAIRKLEMVGAPIANQCDELNHWQ